MTITITLLGIALVLTAGAIDIKTHLLPDYLTLSGALVIFLLRWVFMNGQWSYLLLEWIGAVTYFTLIRLVVKGKLGWGDVKFAGLLALLVGYPAFFWLISLAAFTALVFVGANVLLKRMKPKDRIPFGPFLALGYIMERILYFSMNWRSYFGS